MRKLIFVTLLLILSISIISCDEDNGSNPNTNNTVNYLFYVHGGMENDQMMHIKKVKLEENASPIHLVDSAMLFSGPKMNKMVFLNAGSLKANYEIKLYSSDLNGSSMELLEQAVETNVIGIGACLTADSKYVVYMEDGDNENEDNEKLIVMKLADKSKTTLESAEFPEASLHCTKDDKILYFAYDDDNNGESLYSINIDGSGKEIIDGNVDSGNDFFGTFSYDDLNNRILYKKNNSNSFVVYNLETKARKVFSSIEETRKAVLAGDKVYYRIENDFYEYDLNFDTETKILNGSEEENQMIDYYPVCGNNEKVYYLRMEGSFESGTQYLIERHISDGSEKVIIEHEHTKGDAILPFCYLY